MATTKNSNDNNWAVLAHLSGFAGLVIPFANIIAPLIIWLMKKETSPFASSEAKEALNFQITYTILYGICLLLTFILIGIPMMIVLFIVEVVLMIKAAITTSNGQPYRYPMTLRLIS